MKKLLLTVFTLGTLGLQAQNVTIPDANFKAYLVGNTSINTNGDGEIQIAEATAFTGIINCNTQNIFDLTGVEAFTSATGLYCAFNQLTSVDLSQNTALVEFICTDNNITSLDLSPNVNLTVIACADNQLTSLNVANGNNTNVTTFQTIGNYNLSCVEVDDVTYSTNNWMDIEAGTSFSTSCPSACAVSIPDANFKAYLVGNAAINTNGDSEIQCSEASGFTGPLNCGSQSISDLTGIEAFTSLENLNCEINQLTSIDLSQNTALRQLRCQYNQLTSLNLSTNTALEVVICEYNQIAALDVSSQASLYQINCKNNQLTSLDVANGNNTNFTQFDARNNANLTCIDVDDVAYSTTNWTNVDPAAGFSTNCSAPCVVTIPDANFKNYLVNFPAVNTNGDQEIQCSEAAAYVGSMNCQSQNIADLTGIEAFVGVTQLYCQGNQLTSIDLSQNTALELLWCASNQLSSLDISSNISLENLWCSGNNLSTLDVSNNSALTSLVASDNQLTMLNIASNPALGVLDGRDNQISNIDLSNNTQLTEVYLGDNAISSLDVSMLSDLEILYCENTNVTALDLSGNPVFYELIANDAQLSSLNIANGYNTNIQNSLFDVTGNPNLTCIEVDDVAYSTANWMNIDVGASFSTDCSSTGVQEHQLVFEAYPNPTTGLINLQINEPVNQVLVFHVAGQQVESFTTSTFDIAHLADGIYTIRVLAGDKVGVSRFVKQ